MESEDGPAQFAALRDEAERLMFRGQAERAVELHRKACELAPGDFGLKLQSVRLWVRLQDMQAARAAFRAGLPQARTFYDFNTLFHLNSEVFDYWERISIWLELQPRILALAQSGPNAIDARMLAARVRLALRDYDGFLAELDLVPPIPHHELYALLLRTAAFLRAGRFPDLEAPKIFGIGLSKTGTDSLNAALVHLGFHSMHFINLLTFEILGAEDAFLCDAMTDVPVCVMFETLYYMFPNSKFVYTVREPESWERSFTSHYRRNFRSSVFGDIKPQLFTRGGAWRGQERPAIYGNLFAAHDDAISAYRAYDLRVQRFFGQDASRLLVMDIAGGDGWSKLCPFLGRPQPDIPFFWQNKSSAL